MLTLRKLAALALLGLAQTVYAHGEEELGPHQGYIKMPGAYHVEVVPGKNKLDIMLLDIEFKNASVLDSHVKVTIKSGDETKTLSCKIETDHFTCPVDARLLNQPGTLTVESERQLSKGMAVEYTLPFALKK